MDTNVLVSGAISTSGPPAKLADRWLAGELELLTSPALFAELEDVLSRSRIRRFTSRTNRGAALLGQIREIARFTEPQVILDVVRDPDDNRVLEAAMAGEADAIVSGDKDLLSLGNYEGIPIVTAVQFLRMLEEFERRE